MIKRLTIGHYKLTLTFARIAKVIGVNSNLEDGRHILMWDFDDVSLNNVRYYLNQALVRYALSDIYILRTKEPDNYIAYCFNAFEFKRAAEIIAYTKGVDWQFFRFGVYRGHWTLRVTPKNERTPYLVDVIKGVTRADVKPSDLPSWVRYETLSWR